MAKNQRVISWPSSLPRSAPLCTGQLFLLLIRRSLDILCILCILYIFYILCILCTVSCTVSGLARLSLLCSRRRVLVRHHHGIRRPLLRRLAHDHLGQLEAVDAREFPVCEARIIRDLAAEPVRNLKGSRFFFVVEFHFDVIKAPEMAAVPIVLCNVTIRKRQVVAAFLDEEGVLLQAFDEM